MKALKNIKPANHQHKHCTDKQLHFCLFTTVLILTGIQLNAQPAGDNKYDYQCIYRLTYQPDSTDKRSKDSTDMLLLLNKDNSLFAEANTLLFDTLLYYRYKNSILPVWSLNAFKAYRTKFQYYISKNENGQILMNDRGQGFDFSYHRYAEDRNMFDWELTNETDTISTILCQKATCYFGKRLWVAWFATSIPVSDGPYKFCGLPGLIIKINDDKNYWCFTLLSMRQKEFDYHYYNDIPSYYKVKLTTKNAYLKEKRNYLDNMYLLDKQAGVTYKQGDEAGRKMDEKMAKASNNWIEIFP